VESGVLAKIFVPEGSQDVKVNELICIFADSGENFQDLANYQPEVSVGNIQQIDIVKTEKKDEHLNSLINPTTVLNSQNSVDEQRLKVSPIARKIADEKQIDLKKIVGSGPEGRIIKDDVLKAELSDNAKSDDSSVKTYSSSSRNSDEKIAISGMRKVIGDRLLFSKTNIPHFYLNTQCVMDDLLAMRKKINDSLNLKITINDLIVKAVGAVLSKFPEVNRCWGDNHILQCGNIDICVAVDIPDGLITPIVQNVNKLAISDLSLVIKDLVARARDNKLKPNEYQGGSLTISNLGMFGVKSFSAIINPPQASILSIGGVFKQAVVSENDEIKIKSVMDIGISSDHRIVDGALAAKFLNEVKKFIETPLLFLV
jgi:pyruvate dehydrogenase E2 component (dihydrolipoamide acetyltransferase)